MFERYTETARRALFFARYEATALGGQQLEAEHLLLGLLRADKGPTPPFFAAAGLSYNEAKATIQSHWGVRQKIPVSEEIPFSDQTARILDHASEEADRLLHPYVGTGHLLLGVLRESGSFAAGMLTQHGMTVERLRDMVAKPSGIPDPASEAPAEGGSESE